MKIKAFDSPAVGGTFPIKKLSYKNNSLKKNQGVIANKFIPK
jgi:hypothetical protein